MDTSNNSTVPQSTGQNYNQNSYREESEQQQSSSINRSGDSYNKKKRRRQSERSHGFKSWSRNQQRNNDAKTTETITKVFQDRIDSLTEDKNRLISEVERVKTEKAEVVKKLTSKKKIIASKTAEISILAGRLHRIRLALPLQARLQLAEHLKVNVKPEEIQKALSALGKIKNQDLDSLDLVFE